MDFRIGFNSSKAEVVRSLAKEEYIEEFTAAKFIHLASVR